MSKVRNKHSKCKQFDISVNFVSKVRESTGIIHVVTCFFFVINEEVFVLSIG